SNADGWHLSIRHDSRRTTQGEDAVWNVADDNGARANHYAFADADFFDHSRANADPRSAADGDISGKVCAGTDVNSIFENAIVVHTGAGVDDNVLAEDGCGINDRAGGNDRAAAQSCAARNSRLRMHQRFAKVKADLLSFRGKAQPGGAVSNGDDHFATATLKQRGKFFAFGK